MDIVLSTDQLQHFMSYLYLNGGKCSAILLPVLSLLTSLIKSGRNLHASQNTAIYLNLRVTSYCFRFLKTNGRSFEILLPVLIFTSTSSTACHFASARQVLFNLNHVL